MYSHVLDTVGECVLQVRAAFYLQINIYLQSSSYLVNCKDDALSEIVFAEFLENLMVDTVGFFYR